MAKKWRDTITNTLGVEPVEINFRRKAMDWKNKFPKENRYYETENGILYCGDCLEIMKNFPEESIDSIFTSPPYNIGIDYGVYKDNKPFEDYWKWIEDLIIEFKRILTVSGRVGINHLYDCSKPFRYSPICELYSLIKKHLHYYTIIDLKEISPHRTKHTAWGSWCSPSSPYIYNPKEGIVVGYKYEWKKNKQGETDLSKKEFMEIVSGEWNYSSGFKQLTKCNFSETLPYKWIKGTMFIGELILDPFAGSGTTLAVAEKLKRRWIGIEISKEYCRIIKDRIEKIVRQPSLL